MLELTFALDPTIAVCLLRLRVPCRCVRRFPTRYSAPLHDVGGSSDARGQVVTGAESALPFRAATQRGVVWGQMRSVGSHSLTQAPTLLSLPALVYPDGVRINSSPAGLLMLIGSADVLEGRPPVGGGFVVAAGLVELHASVACTSVTRVTVTVTPATAVPTKAAQPLAVSTHVFAPFSRLGGFAFA